MNYSGTREKGEYSIRSRSNIAIQGAPNKMHVIKCAKTIAISIYCQFLNKISSFLASSS